MKAEPGHDIDPGSGVGPGHQWNASAKHGQRHLQFHREKLTAIGDRIGVQLFQNAFGEFLVSRVAQTRGGVLGTGTLGEIEIINQPLAVLPGKRWNLPGLVFSKERNERVALWLTIGFDNSARPFGAFQ